MWLVSAAFLAVAAYVYVLTSLIVSPAVAAQWSGKAVPSTRLFGDTPDSGLALYGGVYVQVAVLFGLLAVSILLAGRLERARTT